ncbi:MAG: NUDIX domain-containing protein [Crocinitomicaceae bacterium]
MYKVFIENRPIIFLTQQDLTTLHNDSKAIVVHSLKELFERIPTITEALAPIFCVDEKPKKLRKKLFLNYKIIPAAGGIVQSGDNFLFIKRLGFWDIPKGKIDEGEKTKVAAVREIEEECGIKGPIIHKKLIKTFHTYTYKGKKSIKKTTWYHLFYDGNLDTKPQLEEDITEARWFKQSDFEMLKKESFASIKEVIEAFELSLLKK